MNEATTTSDAVPPATTMAERAADWLVRATLAYRALMMPTALASAYSIINHTADAYVLPVIIAMTANIILAISGPAGRLGNVIRSRAFMIVDPAFAILLNVWTTAFLRPGTVLMPGRDVFWMYTMGTVVLWTCLRGFRAGLAYVAGGVVLQIWMALFNRSALDVSAIIQIAGRVCWLFAGLVVLYVIWEMAHRGARLAAAEWQRAGLAEERVRALRDMHDTVLQTLAQIKQRCADTLSDRTATLRYIAQLAEEEANALRTALQEDEVLRDARLRDRLMQLSEEFHSRGLTVDLDVTRLTVEFPPSVVIELTGAVREALTNVRRHARTVSAEVVARDHKGGAVIIVRDRGAGFVLSAVGGFGLAESIIHRIQEVGGDVRVWSTPGKGTTVRVVMRYPDRGIKSPDELTNRALGWFAVPALAYRVCLSPVQMIQAIGNIGHGLPASLLFACGAILSLDLVVLVGLFTGRFRRLLRSTLVLVVDVAAAVGLNLWTAVALPSDTILMPGHQVLWGYMIAVIALWTGIRSKWVGGGLVVGGALVQTAMVVLNRAMPTFDGVLQVSAQWSMLAAALVTASMIMALATGGARVAMNDSMRAGRAAGRAALLHEIHLGALQSLEEIAARARDRSCSEDQLLRSIQVRALRQIRTLRTALEEIAPDRGPETTDGLAGTLQTIVEEFEQEGLRVELVLSELTPDLEPALVKEVADVAREALINVVRHAATSHAVLRAQDRGAGVEVVVRDHGRGFRPDAVEGIGVPDHIVQRVRELGGDVEVWSELGNGTKVRVVSHR